MVSSTIKDKNSPYRDYYIIRKGKKTAKPPNNWTGFSVKSVVENWGYRRLVFTFIYQRTTRLKLGKSKVEEIIDILRYWLDKGVDFR